MNSVDLFYQIFKMRYSIDELNRAFSEKYRLVLVGGQEETDQINSWLGEKTLCSGASSGAVAGDESAARVDCLPIPQNEEERARLRDYDLAIIHLGYALPERDHYLDLLARIPAATSTLFVYQPAEDNEVAAWEAGIAPPVRLRLGRERSDFYHAVFDKLPRWSMRLSRDYAQLREACLRSLVLRACRDNTIIAAASSVTVSTPIVGQLLGLLAVSAETLAITAGQLRVALLVGALYGRSLNFFDRVDELWPVLGGAWLWRTLARELVGLVPAVGPVAKSGVAFVGTYVVGVACQRFYELGEVLPSRELRDIECEAKAQASSLVSLCLKGEMSEDLLGVDAGLKSDAPAPVALPGEK